MFLINKQEIKLIVYDFDGVLTDNRVLMSEDGTESVFVNRSDGLAITRLRKLGINQIIISTESNNVVFQRARKLNIPCYQDVENKKNHLASYCKGHKILSENVIFIGNDINDFEVMSYVGIPICPFDAADEIKRISKYILKTKGGHGCIRELYNLIIK